MNDGQRDELVEMASTAYRPRDRSGAVLAHPVFADLDAAGRELLHRATEQQRLLEAALDADGLSTTARALLARIRGA